MGRAHKRCAHTWEVYKRICLSDVFAYHSYLFGSRSNLVLFFFGRNVEIA